MQELTNGILSVKLLEACGCDISNSIYAFLPNINEDTRLYTNSLHNLPQVLDSSISLFTDKKPHAHKKSIYFINIKRNEEKILKLFNGVCDYIGHEGQRKIGCDRLQAALSYIISVYLSTYMSPIQFFLPYSSTCSGKWQFWDSINFFAFKEKLKNKEFNFDFREKMAKNKIWKIKFDLNTFPVIVQRRLLKEKLLDKKLNPASMIKAIIIRMGETGRPFINYEIVDFSIRELFIYLGEKKYLRVDREMEFLKRLDGEIIATLKESLEG